MTWMLMMKKIIEHHYKTFGVFEVLVFMLFSCTSRLYVAPRQADCTGISNQQCLLIRSNPEGNWILHYDQIEGFDYEPGFRYTIKVRSEQVKSPPADGSSIKYILVEVMEKMDVTDDMESEDLINKEWKLSILKADHILFGIEGNVPTLTFHADGRISGNGGCNNFFGNFKLTGRTISIGALGSTKMACEEAMELEQAYFKVLGLELRGLFNDGKLILTADGGNQMIFTYQ